MTVSLNMTRDRFRDVAIGPHAYRTAALTTVPYPLCDQPKIELAGRSRVCKRVRDNLLYPIETLGHSRRRLMELA